MATEIAPLVSYRNAVTELIKAGKPLDDVEEVIDAVPDIGREEKAALWLYAFSLLDRPQRREVRAQPVPTE